MHSKCNAFCFQNILYYIYVEGCQKDAFYSLSFTSYRYKDLLGYNLLVQCMRRQNILPHLLSSNVSCLWWTSEAFFCAVASQLFINRSDRYHVTNPFWGKIVLLNLQFVRITMIFDFEWLSLFWICLHYFYYCFPFPFCRTLAARLILLNS